MRRFLIPCAMLLGSCGQSNAPPPPLPRPGALIDPTPIVDPGLYETCPGWTGPPPELGVEFALAVETEIACRQLMAGQLDTLARTHRVR
ncbi:hypothetical protein [Roseicyclus amphidinii]|uniref:hypothetical protein n=1 Tax=Roseicyclus amphidinii TaxID=3034232 RepID=UPI0024E0E1D2|nr:hypothetical protein [Roseicyclus sp. Amp-Y-6]